jgi:putative hemolysin
MRIRRGGRDVKATRRNRPLGRPKAMARLPFLKPRKNGRRWLRRPGFAYVRRRKARPLGHGGRSKLKGFWGFAMPILRYCFRRRAGANAARSAAMAGAGAVQEPGAGVRMEPLQFNHLEVRLAQSPDEVEAAQALRYRVFYDEMGATPSAEVRALKLDVDRYDPICDHLLVIDKDKANGAQCVVGTYRLLRRSVAQRHGGFYSDSEYDTAPLKVLPGELVELGRSCVDPGYRSRSVMQLLWRGLAAYVHTFDIHLMFGCASFPGTDPAQIGAGLAYLHHYHLAPRPLRPRALPQHYVPMDRVPRTSLDVQAAIGGLPPLIKGYLRVGGFVGDGAVVDHQFNTTDVCVIVKTDQLTAKYERRYRRTEPDARPR